MTKIMSMKCIHIACLGAALILPWMAIAADEDKDADNVRLVTTGEILKIDYKKKAFEFRIVLDDFPRGFYGRGGGRGGRMGGRGRFPGPFPPNGRGVQYVPVMDIKVFTSEKTSLKSSRNSVEFSIFKVGERVTVTGVHRGKGTDIDALEVSK
jgi:hypothetical protein